MVYLKGPLPGSFFVGSTCDKYSATNASPLNGARIAKESFVFQRKKTQTLLSQGLCIGSLIVRISD